MEDSKIIELYENRDQQAISQSDIKYGGYCYSVGYNILGVREDTEECVNETWLRAWNSIPPQKPRMLSAFFGRITRNIAFDRYRASKTAKRGKGEMRRSWRSLTSAYLTMTPPRVFATADILSGL